MRHKIIENQNSSFESVKEFLKHKGFEFCCDDYNSNLYKELKTSKVYEVQNCMALNYQIKSINVKLIRN